GVRRIEATTGLNAENIAGNIEADLMAVKELLNNTPNLLGTLKKVLEDNETYRKAFEQAQKEKAAGIKNSLKAGAQTINGISLMTLRECASLDMARSIAAMLSAEMTSAAFVAAFEAEGKPCLVLMYTPDLVAAGRDAGADIRQAARFIQGGGGGQKGLATAGGKNIEGLAQAAETLIGLAVK
ncbi:MAG: alanine--tRNA ligase, partial [Bacteroidales bacterium]|nr:alanine--tRNA ligase [Bacteroidales bacterium]